MAPWAQAKPWSWRWKNWRPDTTDFPMKIMGFSGFNFPKKTNPLIARCHRELQGNAGSIYHHYLWMRFFNVKKHGRFIGDVHGIMHYFHKTWVNIFGCAVCQWFGWFSRKSMVIVFTVSGWFLKKNQVICLWCACNLYICNIYVCMGGFLSHWVMGDPKKWMDCFVDGQSDLQNGRWTWVAPF